MKTMLLFVVIVLTAACASTRDNSVDRLAALAGAQPTWHAAVTGAAKCKSVVLADGCADAEAVAGRMFLEGRPFAGMERADVEAMFGPGTLQREQSGAYTRAYARLPDPTIYVTFSSVSDTVQSWTTR